MDIDTKVSTSFDWDEDIVDYQMNNMESIDWIKGHIHSHNDMDVFFSGTDISELNDNCRSFNFYLSVIVNNFGEILGKIAFAGKQKTEFTCKDEEGNDFNLKVEFAKEELPSMLIYNCKFDESIINLNVPNDFKERMKLIDEKSKQRRALQTKDFHTPTLNGATGTNSSNAPTLFKDQKNIGDWGDLISNKNIPVQQYRRSDRPKIEDEWEEESVSTMEEFSAYVIRLGEMLENDTISEALNDIEIANLNAESLANTIMDNYPKYYDNFFELKDIPNPDKLFIDTLDGVIDYYKEHETLFKFLTPVIERLEQFSAKYDEYSRTMAD